MILRFPIVAALALALCGAQPLSPGAPSIPARLEALAEQGNAEALYHLGMIYHLGVEGVARDRRRALAYFRRSAEAGDPLGAYKLGCYYAGQGGDVVPPDEALALRYKLIAAEAGYDLAQVEVAQILHERDDFDRALYWLEAAARQGNAQGIGGAMFYRSPDGPRPDGPRAWLYFELMRRDMARMFESLDAGTERPSVAEMSEQLRQMILPNVGEADRARGAQLLAEWREERSALSLKADSGLSAARQLVGGAAS